MMKGMRSKEEDSDGEGDHEYENEGTINHLEIEDDSANMVALEEESLGGSITEFSRSELEFESGSYISEQSHRSKCVSAEQRRALNAPY
jgi:hypothetical protein